MNELIYLAVVNIIIWIGIFFYLLYIHKKINKIEKEK